MLDLRGVGKIEDGNDIEAWLQTTMLAGTEIPLGGAENLPLFARPDSFLGCSESQGPSGLYFSKDEEFPFLRYDVDLADRGAEVPGDNFVAIFGEIESRGIFSPAAK